MNLKFDHRYFPTEKGDRIVDFDTITANDAVDRIIIPTEEERDRINSTDERIAEDQMRFGGLARRIVGAPPGNPEAELAYYSGYLIPRILRNLGELEKGSDPIARVRGALGNRIDAVMDGIVISEKGSIKSPADLWKLYRLFLVEGSGLRKKMAHEGLDSVIGTKESSRDVKRVIVYQPEFLNLMVKSAEGAGVNLKQLIKTLTEEIMSSYGQHIDHSQLVLDKNSYALEMMRVYFEKNGYLSDFQEQDETIFENFLSLNEKMQELIAAFSSDDVDDQKGKLQEVVGFTLRLIKMLTEFYTNHVVHSGVVMQAEYPLPEEVIAAGIASIKWHLLLAHFVLTQKKLLKSG